MPTVKRNGKSQRVCIKNEVLFVNYTLSVDLGYVIVVPGLLDKHMAVGFGLSSLVKEKREIIEGELMREDRKK